MKKVDEKPVYYHNGSIIVKNGIAYVLIYYKDKWYLRKIKR